jgi:hypothetical protein
MTLLAFAFAGFGAYYHSESRESRKLSAYIIEANERAIRTSPRGTFIARIHEK